MSFFEALKHLYNNFGWYIGGLFAFAILYSLIEKLIDNRKHKSGSSNTTKTVSLETVVPKSVSELAFKCDNCGASYKLHSGDRITVHCPFCNATVNEAQTLIDKTIKYHEEQKKLENEKRAIEFRHMQAVAKEKEKIRAHRKDLLLIWTAIILVGGTFIIISFSMPH